MSIRRLLNLFIIVLAASLSVLAQPPKKKVAVLDFEFGAVQRWWEGDWQIGKGVADLVVDQLLKNGTYRLVERKRIEAVVAEQQNFGNPSQTTQTTTSSPQNSTATSLTTPPPGIGKILGANAFLLGSITQFGAEKQSKRFGAIGLVPTWIGGGRIGKQKGKAKVGLVLRIVDAATSEILFSITGEGMSQRSGFLLEGIGGGNGGIGAAGISMMSTGYRQTILGEATYAAVEDLVKNLIAAGDKIPTRKAEIRGLIADVQQGKVVLNVGSNQGLQTGDNLLVYAVTRAIKDPASGEVLREEIQELGTLQVAELEDRSSVAKILSGEGQIQVGALVRTK
jgi:curli biogenesis system outer membrane secretion channel CsgG